MAKRKSTDSDDARHSNRLPRKAACRVDTHLPSGGDPSAKHTEAPKETLGRCDDHQSSKQSKIEKSTTSEGNRLKVVEEVGDIFAAPPNNVLIHACNCEGHWGAGIAKAFKEHYPEAYDIYHAYCLASTPADLPGTAFLIPPQSDSEDKDEASTGHFVGCLFTSRGKGRTKDPPAKILANTGPAMRDLLYQIAQWNAKDGQTTKVEKMLTCRINSGLFKVPWESTKAVLEGMEMVDDIFLTVMEHD